MSGETKREAWLRIQEPRTAQAMKGMGLLANLKAPAYDPDPERAAEIVTELYNSLVLVAAAFGEPGRSALDRLTGGVTLDYLPEPASEEPVSRERLDLSIRNSKIDRAIRAIDKHAEELKELLK